MDTLAKAVYKQHAVRQVAADPSVDDGEPPTVCAEDVRKAVEQLLSQRLLPAAAGGANGLEPIASEPALQPPPMQAQQGSFAPPPLTRLVEAAQDVFPQKTEAAAEEEEGTAAAAAPDAEQAYSAAGQQQLWGGLSAQFLQSMQDALDEMGLNSAAGTAELAGLAPDSPRLQQLAQDLSERLGMGFAEALEMLLQWQKAQAAAKDAAAAQEKEAQLAKKQRRKALVPIWRCAVCGSADQPYIACYTAPYIVRYEARDAA